MLESSLLWLLRLPRWQKRVVQVLTDVILLAACFLVAMFLRLDSAAFLSDPGPWISLAATLPVTVLIFVKMGFYRAVIRYISTRALITIFWGVFASSVFLLVFSQIFNYFVPRSVPGIYAMLSFLCIGSIRFFMRELFYSRQNQGRATALIYGAGPSGRDLAKFLSEGRQYIPVGFVDESPGLQGSDIMGLRVYSPEQLPQLLSDHAISIIMLAKPRLTRSERKEIIDELAKYTVQVQTVPEIDDIVSGQAEISEVREVEPTDLLGRDPVPPKTSLMSRNIKGRSVLVTGAGGSIGSELCRQIIQQMPKKLVMLDISEPALYAIDMELQERAAMPLHPVLGTVRDPEQMRSVLAEHDIETVFHAAAYKHVPLVEENAIEGFRNNVLGTRQILTSAIDKGVSAFIMVSTDKAVRPTNIMGATKRLAEMVCQAAAHSQSRTRISMVRFGNVLGSSGSVIPLFRSQIARGGPVTVTHREITRYFMSIPEAAQLVIQAGAMAKGGDVFLLDMGEPVRIFDLAERMIRLSGLVPFIEGEGPGDIEVTFTGLRPGEKLYEELLIGADAGKTSHTRIMTAHEDFLPPEQLTPLLERMAQACQQRDCHALIALLEEAPLGYARSGQITLSDTRNARTA